MEMGNGWRIWLMAGGRLKIQQEHNKPGHQRPIEVTLRAYPCIDHAEIFGGRITAIYRMSNWELEKILLIF